MSDPAETLLTLPTCECGGRLLHTDVQNFDAQVEATCLVCGLWELVSDEHYPCDLLETPSCERRSLHSRLQCAQLAELERCRQLFRRARKRQPAWLKKMLAGKRRAHG